MIARFYELKSRQTCHLAKWRIKIKFACWIVKCSVSLHAPNPNKGDSSNLCSYKKFIRDSSFLGWGGVEALSPIGGRLEDMISSYKTFIDQSSAMRTLGLRMVRTAGPRVLRSQSGPNSISAFWFAGSTSALFGPWGSPNNIILSTRHSDEYGVFPIGDAAFTDVSFPPEKTKRRWM